MLINNNNEAVEVLERVKRYFDVITERKANTVGEAIRTMDRLDDIQDVIEYLQREENDG